jgi:hypothetical protein
MRHFYVMPGILTAGFLAVCIKLHTFEKSGGGMATSKSSAGRFRLQAEA